MSITQILGESVNRRFFKAYLPINTPQKVAFFNRVLSVVNRLNSGSTVINGSGSWLDKDGKTVLDDIKAIEFYHSLKNAILSQIVEEISVYQENTGESEIALVIDNEMGLFSQTDLKRLISELKRD